MLPQHAAVVVFVVVVAENVGDLLLRLLLLLVVVHGEGRLDAFDAVSLLLCSAPTPSFRDFSDVG